VQLLNGIRVWLSHIKLPPYLFSCASLPLWKYRQMPKNCLVDSHLFVCPKSWQCRLLKLMLIIYRHNYLVKVWNPKLHLYDQCMLLHSVMDLKTNGWCQYQSNYIFICSYYQQVKMALCLRQASSKLWWLNLGMPSIPCFVRLIWLLMSLRWYVLWRWCWDPLPHVSLYSTA